MDNFSKDFSFGLGKFFSYFAKSNTNDKAKIRTKDEEEIDQLQMQLRKTKVFYRCSRVKLVDLKQEIRLLNTLVDGGNDAFYKRRLAKFCENHDATVKEVQKFKTHIELIESRIEQLKLPAFLRNKVQDAEDLSPLEP